VKVKAIGQIKATGKSRPGWIKIEWPRLALLSLYSSGPFHPSFIVVFFQVAAFVFFTAATPASLIAAQIRFFPFGWFVEKPFEYSHLESI
jgi:hypothetical protein